LLRIKGWITEVKTLLPTLFCNLRKRYTELSNTFTCAPKAIAVRAAYSPTVPAPIITISVGGTPVTPPTLIPCHRTHCSDTPQQSKPMLPQRSHPSHAPPSNALLHLSNTHKKAL